MIFRTRPSKPDQECGITIKNTTQEEEWMSPPYICHTYFPREKTGSFRILANYSDAKNFKRYPTMQGMPSETLRPGLSDNVVVFVAIIF